MNKHLDLRIKEIHELLVTKKITPLDLVEEVYSRIEENSDLNSFITLNKEEAIEYAKKLLNTKTLTALEVSLETGFDDPAYFCRIFKNYTGVTTGEYMNSIENNDI